MRLFSDQNWFFKFKLHHLVFWALYHFAWWAMYEGSAERMVGYLFYPPIFIKYASYVVIQAAGVYFCLYFLIPRFLERRNYWMFLGLLTLTIVAMSLLIFSGYHIGAYAAGQSVQELFKLGEVSSWILVKNNTLPSSLASMTLGMSIKLAKNYIEAQQRQQELEKEKLETELKFLKSQFNPHFLFNTINSIFVLINKNTHLASESLAKFSGLLRYQLYECNEPQIPLNRELAYLESFVELEKLRQNENFEIKTKLLPGYTGSHHIAPFVLMPFIENAFKHVSQGKEQLNWIKIDMSIQQNQLIYQVSNSFSRLDEPSRDAVNYGGLGLKNVKRRLDLLYPDSYDLSIVQEEGVYQVKLILQLKKQKQSEIVLIES